MTQFYWIFIKLSNHKGYKLLKIEGYRNPSTIAGDEQGLDFAVNGDNLLLLELTVR